MRTQKSEPVLIIGFNTRPLAYSLNQAGYKVYAVDFFGDLDLYPYVEDSLIVTKRLGANYTNIKNNYSDYLVKFALEMLSDKADIKYFLIGSGLDDNFHGRELILKKVQEYNYDIVNVNNNLETIKQARDISFLYDYLKLRGYKVPITLTYSDYEQNQIKFSFPLILKKRKSSGGINIIKIENKSELKFNLKILKATEFDPNEWLVQEFINGLPISCTVISNGTEVEIITINRQMIGEKFLHPPKEFIYCGNVVPANLLKEDNNMISEISILLTKHLGLKGINGFDFVLKNHYPFLMEINPRIPGSIRASESVINLNLLDLHIQSFYPKKWEKIRNLLHSAKIMGFATKLIIFAPKKINFALIDKINNLKYVHDKSEPIDPIMKGEPLCTVLYRGKTFAESYFGALKIIDKIKNIIR